ncbi:MAG: dimethylmenaquinone methyltransferase, partial [Lachnospiraceae bacterium]|nr:dimethylmenaquinone methyltransferase [Lachnospiraceae bacterium]
GYKTVFWSIAYGDYDVDNQPVPGYVLNHFTTYHHNGAIALMHNASTSNVKELDAVLTMLEKNGYRFALLNELD